MVERIKNKKGFTIIEIMVVIALIGILAAVLVPKFGGVKDRAKDAGVLTNAKMVEAYVASVIDSYKNTESDKLEKAIEDQFTANTLTNPYTGDEGNSIDVSVSTTSPATYETTGLKGVIYVIIDKDKLDTYINGFDVNENEITATERTVKK